MIEELFEDLDLDKEPKPDSKLKKIFIFIVGMLLVVLMLSYLFVTFPIADIIKGQLESSPLQGKQIQLDDLTIIFEEGTEETLTSIYLEEQKVEFSVCLQGNKEGSNYYVTSLYQPEMIQQSFSQVSFVPCNQETVVMLHSHPYKSCLASETDLETLEKTKEHNPDVLMVIMCEPERFSVYK